MAKSGGGVSPTHPVIHGSEKDQIKIIAERNRWVLVETVFDRKMIEANAMLHWRVVDLYRYVKTPLETSPELLRRVTALLPDNKKQAPNNLTVLQQLQWYGKVYPWTYHELAVQKKESEALALSRSVSLMMNYLLEEFKNNKAILEFLSWLQLNQRYPRKSIRTGLVPLRKKTG